MYPPGGQPNYRIKTGTSFISSKKNSNKNPCTENHKIKFHHVNTNTGQSLQDHILIAFQVKKMRSSDMQLVTKFLIK